jgi:hypothetical protein
MTKRIPGAKRGRPAKPKPPKRARREAGRPETPLSMRPGRYRLAVYEALVSEGFSRRAAMQMLQAAHSGLLRATADGVAIWMNPKDREGFAKHCERIRVLARRHAAKPADQAWLRAMSEAIRIAVGPWHPAASAIVLRLAASANETEWARRKLLPMLLAEAPAAPEPARAPA